MGYTKPRKITETKLQRIAKMSQEQSELVVNWLMPHYNVDSLEQCFKVLAGRKALGVDRVSKEEYGQKLKENLAGLVIG